MKTTNQILKLAEYFLSVANKATYEIKQEFYESNPQELDKYLDYSKNYMNEYRKKNPEKIKQIMEKARLKEQAKRKELKSSNSIEGIALILGQKTHSLKSDTMKKVKNCANEEIRKKHLESLAAFEPIAKAINDLRFNLKEYLYGIDHSNPSYVAKPETLYSLITQATQIHEQIKQKLSNLSTTLEQLIIKMKELSDNYSQN